MEMAKASRMVTLVPVDFITDDEKRKLCGMPPLTAEQKAELAARRTTVPPPSIADKVPIEASV
jgi:hypothetical protein